jgi:hypothetical protein
MSLHGLLEGDLILPQRRTAIAARTSDILVLNFPLLM